MNHKDEQEHAAVHPAEDMISEPGISRRAFLTKLGAGAASTLLMMSAKEGLPLTDFGAEVRNKMKERPPSSSLEAFLAAEEPFSRKFAGTLLLYPRSKYITAGQKGSQPIPILERFKEGLDQIAKDPFPVYLEPSGKTREKIARGYGARVDEIAISRNTTDAISQILSGIDWHPGDELVSSTIEYPNCVATLLRVAKRFGLIIRQFGVPLRRDATAEEVVASVRRQIRPGKTKAIYFSCPAQPNGQVLPARRLARLAQEYGIITVMDGAHYGGMFVPELDALGVDFIGIAGHKWQCGPGGTGILFVRNAAHPANPTPLPRFHLIRSGDLDAPTDGSRPEGFDIGAALSLYGFPESADWRALGEACELWDVLGRRRIQNYILALADYVRQRIASSFGEEALLQPTRDPELKSGIIAFNPFPRPSQRRDFSLCSKFSERMFSEFGYHIGLGGLGPKGLTRLPDPEAKAFPEGCIPNRDPETSAPAPTEIPLRVDACLWNRRQDYDQFIEASQEMVKKIGQ